MSGLLWGYARLADRQETQPSESQTVTAGQSTPSTQQTLQETIGPTQAPTLPDPAFPMASSHVFVYDTARGQLLFTAGDPDARISPASLTKLFSAYVALQYLKPQTVITAGEEVTWIDPESSVAFIYRGQKVTVEQCVKGMLMQSGNDAAYILAVAAGRAISGNANLAAKAALSIFIGKMNEMALQLGLENTHFANPDGIDAPGHYTSLQDLAAISALALEHPLIRACAATVKETVTYISGETVNWKNTNELLHPESEFYCEAACGLKTGSTTAAGKCLISAFRQEQGYLIIGVLGSPNEDDRYLDTLKLYHYYTGQSADIKTAA
jgi:D-alanyl-D-alanine carboxypeptidase